MIRQLRELDERPLLFISLWDLHPEVEPVHDLLRVRQYALALREVADRFIERCRDLAVRAGEHDIARENGGRLINLMFGVPDRHSAPLFAFNEFQARNEQTEHRGFWRLAAGLIDAFRNPRSHGRDAGFTPSEAFEWLCFLSTMHRLLDRVSYLGRDEVD